MTYTALWKSLRKACSWMGLKVEDLLTASGRCFFVSSEEYFIFDKEIWQSPYCFCRVFVVVKVGECRKKRWKSFHWVSLCIYDFPPIVFFILFSVSWGCSEKRNADSGLVFILALRVYVISCKGRLSCTRLIRVRLVSIFHLESSIGKP